MDGGRAVHVRHNAGCAERQLDPPLFRRLQRQPSARIKSTAVAFLDAYVLEDRSARTWLRSRRLLRASGGIAGIERK